MTAVRRDAVVSGQGTSVLEFVQALDAAQAVFRGISEGALAELGGGISVTQLRLLDRLSHAGESRLIDLADALSIAPSTATRLCDALAERRLIVRQRRGRDRRELQIRLTEEGADLVGAIKRSTAGSWERLLERISISTRRLVVAVLAGLDDSARLPSPAHPSTAHPSTARSAELSA